MGTTNIYDPIKYAINIDWKKNGHKRIFMLTDGVVDDNRDELIEITKGTNSLKFYTFGIGDDCDMELV